MRLMYGILITFIFLKAPSAFSAAPSCRFVLEAQDNSTFVQKLIGYKVAKDHEIFRQGGTPSTKTLSLTSVKVVVWNAYKGKKNSFEQDLKSLGSNADLLLIQEAFDHPEASPGLKFPFENFSDHEWVMAVSFTDRANSATGVATASRVAGYPPKFIQSDVREPISQTPKMALLTEYPIENSESSLLVVNIHCINFVQTSDFASQLTQVEKAIQSHQGPLLLAGDFNTWNGSRQTLLEELALRLNLIEIAVDDDHRFLVLDRAFIRGINVKEARIDNSIKGSDHKPIILELDIIP